MQRHYTSLERLRARKIGFQHFVPEKDVEDFLKAKGKDPRTEKEALHRESEGL